MPRLSDAGVVLLVACMVHLLHDGIADALYLLLPLWSQEFGLTLFQIGALRAAFSSGMALFQIPAGFLAERHGESRVLLWGTVVTGAGVIAATGATDFDGLIVFLVLAGLGSGVQHPLGSALVSTAFEHARRRAALGTYNFAGDLGKVSVPSVLALAVVWWGWRTPFAAAGAAAVAMVLVMGVFRPWRRWDTAAATSESTKGWGIRNTRAFSALGGVGLIDYTTRTACLTFLPFVLRGKGAGLPAIGGALALVFAGGATGKFLCGLLAERIGIVRTVVATEIATALGMAAVVVSPLGVAMGALFPLGIALNGTSSVLYATVADLVFAHRRSRAYGLYYTVMLGAAALAPAAYGALGDRIGVPAVLLVASACALLTIPLVFVMQQAMRERPDRVGPALAEEV